MRVETLEHSEFTLGREVTVWRLNGQGQRTSGQGGTIVKFNEHYVTVRNPMGTDFTYPLDDDHLVEYEVEIPLEECMQYESGVCSGRVDNFSPTGMGGPLRCEYHIEKRMESYENSMERYADSDVEPDWFDESYAGERWSDD